MSHYSEQDMPREKILHKEFESGGLTPLFRLLQPIAICLVKWIYR